MDSLRFPPLHLAWFNVRYTVQAGRRRNRRHRLAALSGVSGTVDPGEMVAILGPTGAGKSTLLNILAGRMPSTGSLSGTVLVDGRPRPAGWRKVAGYVEQDDILYRDLTVQECIEFATRMRSPSHTSAQERQEQVSQLIHDLGLEGVAGTQVGDSAHHGVSGGERKRTCIAVELAAVTRVLFLDEPTSGLDAFTAYYTIETIRERIAGRRTVVMTVHRPRANILAMFDKVLLLAEGRTVFFGPLAAALQHFATLGYPCAEGESPADFFLNTLGADPKDEEARGRVEKLVAAWNDRHGANASLTSPLPTPFPTPLASAEQWPNRWLTEFWALLVRAFRVQLRDRPNLAGLVIQTLGVALLLSFIFFQMDADFVGVQNRIGLLFFVPITLTFTMVMPLISIVAIDRAVVRRERSAASYRTGAFYCAEFVSLLPLRLALATVFSFILYYISGLRTDSFTYFLVFLTLVLMLTLAAVCLGLAIGAAMPTVEAGQILGPLVIVIFLIFGGNLANANSVTWILRWIQYTSIIFYTYQGLVQNELRGQPFGGTSGDVYLERFSLDQVPWYLDVVALAGLSLVFLGIGYVALRISTKPNTKLL